MKTTIKTILPIIFCVSIFNCCLATVAMGAERTGLSKLILGKMIENRDKVENFKCINEQFISFSTDILKNIRGLNLKIDRPREDAQKRIYCYQVDHLALDKKGSGRQRRFPANRPDSGPALWPESRKPKLPLHARQTEPDERMVRHNPGNRPADGRTGYNRLGRRSTRLGNNSPKNDKNFEKTGRIAISYVNK